MSRVPAVYTFSPCPDISLELRARFKPASFGAYEFGGSTKFSACDNRVVEGKGDRERVVVRGYETASRHSPAVPMIARYVCDGDEHMSAL
jgi:hypothetical protein